MIFKPALPVMGLVLIVAPAAAQRPTTMAHRSTVYAPHGVIATSQPLATAAGLAVLQRGGNAIDAAVTAAAVLNVVEPMMTGIGGDMFALIWSRRNTAWSALNASGRAGALMTREALLAKRGIARVPERRFEAITVPGALPGWDALLKRYGTITLAQALAPGDRVRRGRISRSRRSSRATGPTRPDGLQQRRRRARHLPDRWPPAPSAGEWFRNPDLARDASGRSPRRARRRSTAARWARRIVTGSRQLGGFLTLDDLQKPSRRLGDADLGAVQRLPGVGAAAEQPGHRRARDAAHPRAVRPQPLGHNSAAVPASPDRGEEARLRRPGAVRRRRRTR